MPLSTVPDLEKFLQVDITDDADAAVLLLIDFADSVITSYCDRRFEPETSVVEVLDGLGDEVLFLSQWPVTAINSLSEDGSTLVEDTDWFFYEDGRLLRGSPEAIDRLKWSRARKNVVVDYDHGFASIPSELQLVSTRLASTMFQAGEAYANAPVGSTGIKSISLDGSDTVEYNSMVGDVAGAIDDLDKIETTLLSGYKRVLL